MKKDVQIIINVKIDEDAIDTLKTIEHHIEYLLDLDNWSEIESVSNVRVLPDVPSPNEFAEQMQNIVNELNDDQEVRHSSMDNYIIELLKELGYGKGAEIFESTPKWYA